MYKNLKNNIPSHGTLQRVIGIIEYNIIQQIQIIWNKYVSQKENKIVAIISKKMGISDSIIEKSKKYIETKDYNYKTLNDSKISRKKVEEVEKEQYIYKQGDKVLLLDKKLSGIVYKEVDRFNNLTVLFNNEYLEINYNRLKIEFTAKELYPEGYDLNQLFSTFKERKLEKDIERGSKKGIKKFRKQEGL